MTMRQPQITERLVSMTAREPGMEVARVKSEVWRRRAIKRTRIALTIHVLWDRCQRYGHHLFVQSEVISCGSLTWSR